jgi:hypothetical protein
MLYFFLVVVVVVVVVVVTITSFPHAICQRSWDGL